MEPGDIESIPDLTFVTNGRLLKSSDDRRRSDTQPATIRTLYLTLRTRSKQKRNSFLPPIGWNSRKLDVDKLMAQMNRELNLTMGIPCDIEGKKRAERLMEETTGLMYWLTKEIVPLWREHLSL